MEDSQPNTTSEAVGIVNPFRKAPTKQEQIGSDAKLAYEEWVRMVALLPEWERGEIAKCTDMLGDMVIVHEASAKLAIVGMTLKISMSEGA